MTELDAIICDECVGRWRKVARVITRTAYRLGRADDNSIDAIVGERIIILVEQGTLEGAGVLSDWRHSEIRYIPAAQHDRQAQSGMSN